MYDVFSTLIGTPCKYNFRKEIALRSESVQMRDVILNLYDSYHDDTMLCIHQNKFNIQRPCLIIYNETLLYKILYVHPIFYLI